MKKVLLTGIVFIFAVNAIAQTSTKKFSFVGDGIPVPDITRFLPAPPIEKDVLFKNDSVRYEWGKTQRTTLRGDTALWDAPDDIAYCMKRFGWATGKNLTPENCPSLAKLMEGAIHDIYGGAKHAKKKYCRHRPYQVFKEHTPIPEFERDSDFTSYPSGHSVRAWTWAMVLTAIDPDNEDAYFKTAYDMGESRAILGFHFESDVEAGRLLASAGFARLCAEPDFWAYLELAREEIRKLGNQ